MPTWLEAGLWGLLGGGALVIGAVIAWSVRVPKGVIASVMAFGSGVLISAVAFDLMQEAADTGGLLPAAIGFLGGALAYLAANAALARHGARHRKRSGGEPGEEQPSEQEQSGSGTAIMAPGGVLCISRPLIATSISASSSESTPARHAAAYSPMLWPIIAFGRTPHESHN